MRVNKAIYTDSSICLNTKLGRTKCSTIISNIWYPFFQKELKTDIGDSPYSLIIDESTDITFFKYLGIVIKYYSKSSNMCQTKFLKLQPLEACDANSIVDAIVRVLKEFDLKLDNLSGLGTDNGSVMVGIHNGVFQKLKELNPKIILIPCVCHSLQLAVSAAANEHFPSAIDFLISETYNWFARSSIRQANYRTIYNLINDGHNPLKITQSCSTRWLSIETAVTRICEQYLELKTHFQICQNSEKCFKAKTLYSIYKDDKNLAYLLFLKPILQELQKVNKIFESESADFVKVLNDLLLLILSLARRIAVDRDGQIDYTIDVDKYMLPLEKIYLGYECEELLKTLKNTNMLKSDDENSFREQCAHFLKKLVKELQQRMPKNLNILKQIKMLSVQNCLKINNKSSLLSLLKDFNFDAEKIDKIDTQWKNLMLNKWDNVEGTTESFWCEVINYKLQWRELISWCSSFCNFNISFTNFQR